MVVAHDRVPCTCFGRVCGEGHAQVDTALLEELDMHGEAEQTEKQKARGYCVGVGVDSCRRSASKVCAGVQRRVICLARSGGGRSGAFYIVWQLAF